MPNNVELALEETIPVLRTAERYDLLSEHELRACVADRRHHEYTVMRGTATRKHFLDYIAFEQRFSKILAARASKASAGVPAPVREQMVREARLRVNLVFSRAVRRFRGDAALWLHYLRHLLREDSLRAASRVLARALAFCPGSVDVWRAAISFHFDRLRDAAGARALAHRALRAMPESRDVWIEYFRLELYFLARLVENRAKAGYSPEPTADEGRQLAKRRGAMAERRDGRVAEWKKKNGFGEKRKVSGSRYTRRQRNKRRRRKGADANGGTKEDKDESGGEESDGPDEELPIFEDRGPGEGGSSDGDDARDIGNLPVPEDAGDGADEQTAEHSDEEADEEGDVDTEAHEFWYGAVPVAVLKRGFEKVSFDAKHRAQVFNITTECPWISGKVIENVAKVLNEKFPSCHIGRFNALRLRWEMARCDLDRVKAVVQLQQRSKKNEDDDAKVDVEKIDPDLRKALLRGQKAVDKESRVALKDMETFGASDLRGIEDKEEQEAVLASFKSFGVLLQRFGLTNKHTAGWEKARRWFDLSGEDVDVETDVSSGDNDLSPGDKSDRDMVRDIITFLEKGDLQCDTVVGDVSARSVARILADKCAAPFRDEQQERALAMYLAMESEADSVHAMAAKLVSLPPLRLSTIRCLVDALLRVGRSPADGRPTPGRTDEIRQLFDAGSALPDAKQDVDFWLSYIEFERQVARSAKMTNFAHAKALRILAQDLHETFTESLLLSNLSTAV